MKQLRQKQKRYGAVQPVPAQRLQASGMEAAGVTLSLIPISNVLRLLMRHSTHMLDALPL